MEMGGPSFDSIDDAFDYVYELADDENCDNIRFAWLDDSEGLAEYEQQKKGGCCGEIDLEVTIDGRKALIGCNYGH